MIKVIKKSSNSATNDDLSYWLTKTPEERLSCVEFLRRQYHGNTARLQRFIKVVQRNKS